MTAEEIFEERKKYLEREEKMWEEMLSEKYPIGKVVEIDGIEMKVEGYSFRGDIASVNFSKLVPEYTSKFYFELPKFKEGGKK